MHFTNTLQLLSSVKLALEAIPHPTDGSKRLFEKVEFNQNKQLREALRDLMIFQERVAIIVPSGDRFANDFQGEVVTSTQTISFDLLICDRAYVANGHDAVFGGPANIGVVAMKDAVIEYFANNPVDYQHALIVPVDGAPITVSDPDVKDPPGRVCWAMSCETPAGEIVFRRAGRRR